MRYQVVKDNSYITIEEEVNRLIKLGWKPQGGISSVYLPKSGFCLFQAMVKE